MVLISGYFLRVEVWSVWVEPVRFWTSRQVNLVVVWPAETEIRRQAVTVRSAATQGWNSDWTVALNLLLSFHTLIKPVYSAAQTEKKYKINPIKNTGNATNYTFKSAVVSFFLGFCDNLNTSEVLTVAVICVFFYLYFFGWNIWIFHIMFEHNLHKKNQFIVYLMGLSFRKQ